MNNQKKQRADNGAGVKRKRKSSLFLLYVFLVFAFIVSMVVLSLTVFFHIEKITVAGENLYTSEQIIDASKIELDKNMFSYDFSRVNEYVTSKLPYIEQVKVNRKLPSRIELSVTQAKVYAQIKYKDRYVLINESGKCLEITDAPSKNAPVVAGYNIVDCKPGQIVIIQTKEESATDISNGFESLNQLCSCFEENKLDKISVISVADEQDIWATYDDKIVMLFGSMSNIEKKVKHAAATIELRESSVETGTLNLSRIPNSKNQASFIPSALTNEQVRIPKKTQK